MVHLESESQKQVRQVEKNNQTCQTIETRCFQKRYRRYLLRRLVLVAAAGGSSVNRARPRNLGFHSQWMLLS